MVVFSFYAPGEYNFLLFIRMVVTSRFYFKGFQTLDIDFE